MKKLLIHILFVAFCVVAATLPVAAQEQDLSDNLTQAQLENLSSEMTAYLNEVNQLTSAVTNVEPDRFPEMLQHLQAIDVRWKAYTDLQQIAIAESPILMDILAQYKVLYLQCQDSINHEKARADAENTFNKSLGFLNQIKAKYKNLSSQVMQYSLIPQTADRLDAVKAQEATIFAQVNDQYQKGVAAVAASPDLAARQQELDQSFADIKAMSEKIQAAAYKSWIERAKDYVLTFAGFAIILLFFNLALSKIKQIKSARAMAKKYGDMLNNNDQYPTI